MTACERCFDDCRCTSAQYPIRFCDLCGANIDRDTSHNCYAPSRPGRKACEACGDPYHTQFECYYYITMGSKQEATRPMCFVCGNARHLPTSCPLYEARDSKADRPKQCTICFQTNHIYLRCEAYVGKPKQKDYCCFCGSMDHHHYFCDNPEMDISSLIVKPAGYPLINPTLPPMLKYMDQEREGDVRFTTSTQPPPPPPPRENFSHPPPPPPPSQNNNNPNELPSRQSGSGGAVGAPG